MKTNLKKIGIILGIILVSLLIWKMVTYEQKVFKPIVISSSNSIINFTDKKYLDTIIYVGLNELNLSDISILIKPLSEKTKYQFQDIGELRAHIKGEGKEYIIFIDEMERYESLQVMSHELIHLTQYHSSDLVVKGTNITWKGENVILEKTPYELRPWEIEAFSKQDDLQKRIEKVLY